MADDYNDLKREVIMGKDIRFDPNDDAPDYIGINQDTAADTAGTNWVVYKFTYSGDNITRIQKARGSWDGRALLF